MFYNKRKYIIIKYYTIFLPFFIFNKENKNEVKTCLVWYIKKNCFQEKNRYRKVNPLFAFVLTLET